MADILINFLKTFEFDEGLSNEYIAALQYQGFNPNDYITMLGRKGHELYKAKINDDKALAMKVKADLTMFIVWGMSRGTKISDRALNKTKEESRRIFKETANLWGVIDSDRKTGKTTGRNQSNTGVTAQDYKPDDVLIGRIMACFPIICAELLHREKVQPVGDKVVELPIAFHFPGAPSLMTPAMWEKYGEYYVRWNISFTKVITNNPEATFNKSYINAQMNSKLVPDEVKLRLFEEYSKKIYKKV